MSVALGRVLAIAAVAAFSACRPAAPEGAAADKAPSTTADVQQAAPALRTASAASTPSTASAASLKDFEARFRTAVLAKDVEWILARMDPAGWACGDAEIPASAYAETFRRGEMDYVTLSIRVFGECL